MRYAIGVILAAVFSFGVLTPFAYAQGMRVDHSLYDRVLKECVENGNVDYERLQQDPGLLEKYLNNMAKVSPAALYALNESEKIAFYINVYNALTLKAIIDYYPVKSIKKIKGVWDRLKFEVAGKLLTLDEIEHDILRWEFKEPRIRFALVCAARSCPALRGKAYRGRTLDKMLTEDVSRFISNKEKVRLDKDKNILYLSSIFKWSKKDLGDPRQFVLKYMDRDDATYIRRSKPRIKYLKYDWSLNKQ